MSSRRRELTWALMVAWLLVIARSGVFIVYQQSFFDSDQAIVGLMAKHLIEGRAFPLFYYGQTYLLAVDAWVAAPLFAIAGPTVGALHAAILSINLVIVTLLIVSLVQGCGLRPFYALAASLFFTFAPPFTTLSLIEAGATVGPLLWVVVVWMLRHRPLWFGAALALGVLNREFTIYAVPVLLAGDLLGGTLVRPDRIRAWLLSAAAFLAVWQGVEELKPLADLMGPGTRGQLVHGSAGSEVNNVLYRLSIVPSELLDRAGVMARDYFPRQIGVRAIESATAPQGRDWLYWPVMLGLAAAGLRAMQLTWMHRRRVRSGVFPPSAERRAPSAAFGWYLAGVGFLAVFVYVLTRSVDSGLIDRYLLLSLYLPVGIVAVFLALEPQAWLRRAIVALLVVWSSVSAIDHARLYARYWGGQEPDEVQALADELVARGIRVAGAGYWRAYRVSFLARERVKVAASDVGRITEYDVLARQEGDRLILIQEAPCISDQPKILQWYLCRETR